MDDPTPIVPQNHEGVEQPEGGGRDHEEVHGSEPAWFLRKVFQDCDGGLRERMEMLVQNGPPSPDLL